MVLTDIKQIKNNLVFLDCGINPDFQGSARYNCFPGFNKVPIFDSNENTHPDNLINSEFKIPTTGIYLIYSRVRPVDNTSLRNYGQAVHTSATDGAWFSWSNTQFNANMNRNGLQNTRIVKFNKDESIFLYTYFDQFTEISASIMTVCLLQEI